MKIGGKLLFALAALVLILFARPIYAAQFGITAYPVVIDLSGKPGDTLRFLIQFKNNTAEPITGNVKVQNFIIKDTAGATEMVPEDQMQPDYGAAAWIKPDQSQITISANDYVAVNFTATIPEDANTCGTYAMPYFEYDQPEELTQTGATSSTTQISARVGALVNIQLDVNCKESAQIRDFSVPGFIEYGPVPVSFQIMNDGNIHVSPQGQVQLKNWFNKIVDTKKFDEKRIFPGTAKEYEVKVGGKYLFGRYTVDLNGTYGTNGTLAYSSSLWVVPWRLILIVALLIVIIVMLFSRFKRGLTKHTDELEKELKEERAEIAELKEMLEKKHE